MLPTWICQQNWCCQQKRTGHKSHLPDLIWLKQYNIIKQQYQTTIKFLKRYIYIAGKYKNKALYDRKKLEVDFVRLLFACLKKKKNMGSDRQVQEWNTKQTRNGHFCLVQDTVCAVAILHITVLLYSLHKAEWQTFTVKCLVIFYGKILLKFQQSNVKFYASYNYMQTKFSFTKRIIQLQLVAYWRQNCHFSLRKQIMLTSHGNLIWQLQYTALAFFPIYSNGSSSQKYKLTIFFFCTSESEIISVNTSVLIC